MESAEEFAEEIAVTSFDELESFNRSNVAEGVEKGHFIRIIQAWIVHEGMCAYFLERGVVNENSVCNRTKYRTLPLTWRVQYKNLLHSDFYIDSLEVIPRLKSRTSVTETVCNISPLPVTYRSATKYVQPENINFYTQKMGLDAGHGIFLNKGWLGPGRCNSSNVKVMLQKHEAVPFRSAITSRNEAMDDWFYKTFGRFHVSEILSNSFRRQRENAKLVTQRSYGEYFCEDVTEIDSSSAFFEFSQKDCVSDQALPFFVGWQQEHLNTRRFVTFPGFADETYVFDTDFKFVDKLRLQRALQIAGKWGRVVDWQYSLYAKWNGRSSRFFITRDDKRYLEDLNGPFVQGVWAEQIPSSTILGEVVDIPNSGNLIRVLSQIETADLEAEAPVQQMQINSEYDVFEAMTAHGSNRSLGAKSFLIAVFGNSQGMVQGTYVTRQRFNARARQEFDTNVGVLTGLRFGAVFGFGDWLQQQQYAYARQVNSTGFAFGEALSFLIPYGPGLVKFLGRFARVGRGSKVLGRLSRMTLSGAAEGALSGTYDVLTAPALRPKVQIENAAKLSATLGFAFGFVFPQAK